MQQWQARINAVHVYTAEVITNFGPYAATQHTAVSRFQDVSAIGFIMVICANLACI